jgi:hypothetical protein
MDPYIESCGLWEGFHNHLIHRIDETLAQILPRGYTIDTGVRNYVVIMESEGKKDHAAKPDVTVTQPGPMAESVPMRAFVAEKFKETFVEVYLEGEERILVTCIEVLSPSNKRQGTEGWQQYERKRQAMLLGRANFIEIDLLRGGQKMPMLDPWPKSPYTLLVCRASKAPYCRVWPVPLQRHLPAIPVPLLDPDPDLTLDLQPLLDSIYSFGRYDERIDYGRLLAPPLVDEDAVWVGELLKNQTPRRAGKGRPF